MTTLPANNRPLSPMLFLERAAYVFREKPAVIYHNIRRTYPELAARSYRLASALKKAGIGAGDCVAILSPNTPPMLESHYGVPLTGAMLCTVNIRLAPREVEYIINHCGAKIVLVDTELAHIIEPIRANLKGVKQFINIIDDQLPSMPGKKLDGCVDYEEFIAGGSPEFVPIPITDENHPISINYTSGTTGNPKGVQYSHRSTYLNCLGLCLEGGLSSATKYLWSVPMFHCNGWCFTWGVTAVGGTHVCLRKVDPVDIYHLIETEKITCFCGAPTVLISLYSHPHAKTAKIPQKITVFTGGAPPSPTVIKNMEALNMEINQIYGLTETYGPHTICEWQEQFDAHGEEHRYRMKARQGVPHITGHEMRVVDQNMNDVPADGQSSGEIVMRGNNVMIGYYNDPEATAKAFSGGWFHSGDIAAMHPDGYIEIRDRSKDIIISGGENISSIEVENTIYQHPDVLEVAVIGVPDPKWGEVPKAFVVPKAGANPTEADIVKFCRDNLSHFKCPKTVQFGELPKTSTGKIKKFVLRDKEWEGMEKRVH